MLGAPASALRSKFHGCLIGAVLGDCIGQPYEGSEIHTNEDLAKFFKDVNNGQISRHAPPGCRLLPFTDDTAMARSVADSLISNNGLNTKDMANRFQEEFFKEPDRGYGAGVVSVFEKLNATFSKGGDFDEFQFAREQFNGSGSYGNGGAMRIAPMGLFTYSSSDKTLIDLVTRTSLVTHSNKGGVHGAILECFAVRQALQEEKELDRLAFLDKLVQKMSAVEGIDLSKSARTDSEGVEPETYTDKLLLMKSFLEKDEEVPQIKVIQGLGNNISAFGSVPTAVYSFLRSTQPIRGLELNSPFERTIAYAISLGGDTDTIATMAAAISGAYYGSDVIPQAWRNCCEGVDNAIRQADQLYELSAPK